VVAVEVGQHEQVDPPDAEQVEARCEPVGVVTGVHEGAESERRYRLVPEGSSARLVATEDVVNHPGDVCGFAPPGDIHRVRNACSSTAISLHVYGADIARLGSSVRRVYDLPADEL